jgi:hypothetical protein
MAIKSLLTLKGALLTTAAIVVVGGGIYASSKHNDKSPSMGPVSPKTTQPSADQKSQINYGQPTEEEKAQANAKTNAVQQTNNDKNAQTSGKRSVTPVITSVEPGSPATVRGYVSGVVEDGGTCTATFTQTGKAPISATSQGFKNASVTNCTPITAQLSSGKWSVSLSYSSAVAEGTSAAQSLQL